jgi:hypothetical protein
MKKLVMVDCISQHRIRYVVEVENDINHALDEVVARDTDAYFEEFSQKHLGEVIISHREITKEEYLKIFNIDNDYLQQWTEDQKLKFINRINYEVEENDINSNSGNET